MRCSQDAESESLLQPAGRCSGQQPSLTTNEMASQTELPAARVWKLEDMEVFPVFGNVVTRNNYIHHPLPKMCGFIVGRLTSIVGGKYQRGLRNTDSYFFLHVLVRTYHAVAIKCQCF